MYEILREIQYEVRQIANKTVQMCWEWQGIAQSWLAQALHNTHDAPWGAIS